MQHPNSYKMNMRYRGPIESKKLNLAVLGASYDFQQLWEAVAQSLSDYQHIIDSQLCGKEEEGANVIRKATINTDGSYTVSSYSTPDVQGIRYLAGVLNELEQRINFVAGGEVDA